MWYILCYMEDLLEQCTIATHCHKKQFILHKSSKHNLTQKFLQHQFTLLFSVIFFESSKIDIFVCLSWALGFNIVQIFLQQNEELRRQVNTQQSQLTAQQKLIEKHKETSQKCLQVNKSLLIEKVSMSNVA